MFLFFYPYFSRKQDPKFQSKYLNWGQFAWHVESVVYFSYFSQKTGFDILMQIVSNGKMKFARNVKSCGLGKIIEKDFKMSSAVFFLVFFFFFFFFFLPSVLSVRVNGHL